MVLVTDVCPVKINIHEQLYKWRQVVSQEGQLSTSKKMSMKTAAKILASAKWYNRTGKWVRKAINGLPRWINYNGLKRMGKRTRIARGSERKF